MTAVQHVSSQPTFPTPTMSAGSPPRRARWTSWSTTRASTGSPPTADTDDADFDAHFDTNVRAPYILVQKLVPGMIERGRGNVVNVSTVAATTPAAGAGIYGASKAALELLTKLWADEFGASGVRVNAIAPGPTRTPKAPRSCRRHRRGSRPYHGARANGETRRDRQAVTFLVSPAASYINGAVLPVGGGAMALAPAA